MNRATVTIGLPISLWDTDFISFKYVPRSGIAGLEGSFFFNFLRSPHSMFYNDWTKFITTNCAKGFLPCSLHPDQHLTFCLFNNCHSNGDSSLWFWFAFPWFSWGYLLTYCYWVVWVTLIFWFLTFYLINDLLIFSPVLEVTVLLDCFLGYAEAF